MHTYNDHLRGSHALSQMGRLRSVAPDSLTDADQAAPALDTVPGIAFKPTSAPALDAAERIAVFACPDAQRRIGIGKATAPLGWTPGQQLVAVCEPGRVTVTVGTPTSPAQQPVTLDSKSRLRVGPTATALLRLVEQTQVLAIAVPATGELVLLPAAAALAQLTGPVTIPAPETPTRSEPAAAAPASNVRGRWRPPEVA